MGIFSWIGLGSEVAKPIDSISHLYTTDAQRLEAQEKLEEIETKPVLAQMDINKTFASSERFFNSGWQPLTGWTSGFCVAIYYIPQLLVANVVWAMNCIEQHKVIPFPIDPGDIINLVYLMFGFGAHHLIKGRLSKK